MTNPDRIRDELLEQEPVRPELKTDYERRLKAMFEQELAGIQTKELTPVQRVAFTLSGLMCVGFFLFFGYVGFFRSAGLPWLARGPFFVGSVFGLVFAAITLRAAIKGCYNRKRLPNIYTGGIWVVIVIQSTISMILAGEMGQRPYQGTTMLLSSLIFLVMGVAFLLKNVVEQSTLKVQEDLLRMQIQIAELNERIGKK